MRIEEDLEEIAMVGDDVREADHGVDHQADVARNVGEDREVETADVGEAGTDMIGEVRNIEDNIVVRGGLILISDLWFIHAVF